MYLTNICLNSTLQSKKVISNLPEVVVTGDDLQEESNIECCFCLCDNVPGEKRVKLPCGHLFDRECLISWLERSNTCPVCRYELETDSHKYEEERKRKMEERVVRYRQDELIGFSVRRLKEIMSELGVAVPPHAMDKVDLVNALRASPKVRIVERSPPTAIGRVALQQMGLGELKKLLLNVGIDTSGFLMKTEFRDAILQSDRFIVVDDADRDANEEKDAGSVAESEALPLSLPSPTSSTPVTAASRPRSPSPSSFTERPAASAPAPTPAPVEVAVALSGTAPNEERPSRDPGEGLSISELLGVAEAFNINTSNCVERAELIVRLKDAGLFDT